MRGDVVFEHVSFDYDGRVTDDDVATNGTGDMVRRGVLHDLSFHVPAGQTAALVGSTGAGKSTVVKLLLRFYDVTEGQIRLDGEDRARLKTHDLRRAIGFVSQDVYLFHGTRAREHRLRR